MKAKVDMVGNSFPFSMWAASLKHKPLAGQQSQLIYTYNIKTSWWLRGWADWAVHWVFRYETARRFRRMQAYLDSNLEEVLAWQKCRERDF